MVLGAASRPGMLPAVASAVSRGRPAIWAASVGVVLADSSIVTLALPDILREYDTSVFGVSWVLTAFNLVFGLALLVAVGSARRNPARIWGAGLAVFAAASLGCALSGAVAPLIVARTVQALGGAAIVSGAIELLARAAGTHEAAAVRWGAAGTAGLALGPALGGVLTEAFSWQSIFYLQVPLALGLVLASSRGLSAPEPGPEGVIDRRPEIALGLLSAGLTAALFLLVVMLTEGWALSPIAAAAVVTAIPVATLAASALSRRLKLAGLAAAGTVATAGGLAALGVIPGADAVLTLPPQVLIGAGLALALPPLTAAALRDHDPLGHRASGTVAARHLGIVVGIVLLTPVLSLELEAQHDAARDAGTSLLLDAPMSPETKVEIAESISAGVDEADGRLPDVSKAFAAVTPPEGEEGAFADLEDELTDQVERAATHAFSLPFLGASLLAALALVPIALTARRR